MSRVLFLGLLLIPSSLWAGCSALPGSTLSLWWGLPFLGMLLSLALLPLFASRFWENHYGKVALAWSLVAIIGPSLFFGFDPTKAEVLRILFHHYIPFIIMIGTLYTLAGGIHIDVSTPSTPLINTYFLAIGTFLAGWIGTTGAAMVLVRPFLHMNKARLYRVHHMIFFIFLVGNIGGALTPLGDPPLFLGFLNGVDFFWTIKFLSLDIGVMTAFLLLIFYGLDLWMARREGMILQRIRPHMRIQGKFNGLLFLGVMGCVLLSGVWKSPYSLIIAGISLEIQYVIRDGGLVLLALISYMVTPENIRAANHFSWEPLKEVVKLFFGIFITVVPVVAILDAGYQGAFAPLLSLISIDGHPQDKMYFWLSGGLSAVLDNAPTYLVFFHLAGSNAEALMTTLSQTLVAISLGSVFMGAMTYIGNAPNFMIKTIAESHKVPMPSFFGYMTWSLGILLPLFLLLSWVKF